MDDGIVGSMLDTLLAGRQLIEVPVRAMSGARYGVCFCRMLTFSGVVSPARTSTSAE